MVFLEVAIPMQIGAVSGWTAQERIDYARKHADYIAEKTDVLDRGGKPGDRSAVFNVVARVLACLAHQPGGVEFGGVRWFA